MAEATTEEPTEKGAEPKPNRVCFVIGPIGADGTAIRKHADLLFHAIVQPALQGQYRCLRADMEQSPGLITDAIIKRINESPLVVADFTNLNPNVFYELGIRHAAAKPTIHMASDGTDLPFDNAGSRTIFYDLSDWHRMQKAKAELLAQVKDTESPGYRPSNPVTQALTMNAFRASADSEENAIVRLTQRIALLEKELSQRSKQPPLAPAAPAGPELVDRIRLETQRQKERRESVNVALGALLEDGHVTRPSDDALEDYISQRARDPKLFKDMVSLIDSGNFGQVNRDLQLYDEEIPF